MLCSLLGIPETPLNVFLSLLIGGAISYFSVSGLSYWYFFVFRHDKYHPSYKAKPEEIRAQIKWGVYGTIGNAILTAPFHWGIAHGYSQAYWNPLELGIPWLIASFLIYLAFTETWIYWAHRALHTKWMYKYLHKPHHKWRATTSWASMAFHPLDSFLQAVPHHLAVFLLPVNGYIYMAMLVFVMLWSVIIHDRVSIVKWSVINYTGHHTLHHWFFTCNYGQFFTFWDKAMGTWRDPEAAARDGSVPEWVLR